MTRPYDAAMRAIREIIEDPVKLQRYTGWEKQDYEEAQEEFLLEAELFAPRYIRKQLQETYFMYFRPAS
jgi:hypothetical protein